MNKISLDELLKSKLDKVGPVPDPDSLWNDMNKRLDVDAASGTQGAPATETGIGGVPGPASGAAGLGKFIIFTVLATIVVAGSVLAWKNVGKGLSQESSLPHPMPEMGVLVGLPDDQATADDYMVSDDGFSRMGGETPPPNGNDLGKMDNQVARIPFTTSKSASGPNRKNKALGNKDGKMDYRSEAPTSPKQNTKATLPDDAAQTHTAAQNNDTKDAATASNYQDEQQMETADGSNVETLLSTLPVGPFFLKQNTESPSVNAVLGDPLATKHKGLHSNASFVLFAGSDLERPVYNLPFGSAPASIYLQLGLGLRRSLNNGWALQPELWYHQLTPPSVMVITEYRQDIDGERLTIMDTVSIVKMAGVGLNLQGAKELPFGFSALAGLHLGWYPLALTQDASSTQSTSRGFISWTAGMGTTFDKAPAWMHRFQPGLKLGLEKAFMGRFVMGGSMYQGLRDFTPQPNSGRNYSTNWFAYVGYRFR